jgi:hypothetical protein
VPCNLPLRGYRESCDKHESGNRHSVIQLFATYDAVIAYVFQKKKAFVLDEVMSVIIEV